MGPTTGWQSAPPSAKTNNVGSLVCPIIKFQKFQNWWLYYVFRTSRRGSSYPSQWHCTSGRNEQGPAHRCEHEEDVQEIQSIDGNGVDRDSKPLKRNPKRQKAASKEHYRRVLPCFHVKKDEMPYKRTNKPKVVAIWATCKLELCKFKSPGCRVYGLKTKPSNCPSWSRCVKHVENIHYLLDTKDLEEALANQKAHWNNLRKVRLGSTGLILSIKGKAHWRNV